METVNSVQQCLDGFSLCSRHHVQHGRHSGKRSSQALSAQGMEPRQMANNMDVESEIKIQQPVLDETTCHL